MSDRFDLEDHTLDSYLRLDTLLNEVESKVAEARNILVELTLPVLAVEAERRVETEEDEDE